MKTMAKLRIGTCSWKYDSWKGIVYSGQTENNYLAEYAQHFNTVEIDQWFWSLFAEKKVLLPNARDVNQYAESVHDDFRFTVKIPNSITLTHYYNKNKFAPLIPNPHFLSQDVFGAFLETLTPMKDKIGVLIFQFEYLNLQKMSSLSEFIEKFEAFASSLNKEYIYGIEIRNPNFLKKPYFEFLQRNKLAPVLLQGYYMPPVKEAFKEMEGSLTSPVVLRLHGPDRSSIEKKTGNIWNAIVEPKDEELEEIARLILFLLQKDVDIFVNVNNHYEGSAPLTIQRIRDCLKIG